MLNDVIAVSGVESKLIAMFQLHTIGRNNGEWTAQKF
jgi:hypothetical protein